MSSRRTWGASTLFLALLACSPALDWREVRHEGSGVLALFPCRPQHHVRSAGVEEVTAPMHLLVCSGAGQTFALSYLDVAAPAHVGTALLALRNGAAKNMSATEVQSASFNVQGMTPNANAALVSIRGRASSGEVVTSQVGLFSKGLRVYQATLFGPQVEPQASDTFFSGLKLQ